MKFHAFGRYLTVKVYLDNNIVSAIAKVDTPSESSAIERLLKARDQARVELVTSEVTREEIQRYHESVRPPVDDIYQRLAKVPIVRWDELVGMNSYSDALTCVNTPMIENDPDYGKLLALGVKMIDARHIFVAVKNACDAVLTCDRGVLHRAAGIEKIFGLVVQKPSDFVAAQRW
jgi:hypothetical protein